MQNPTQFRRGKGGTGDMDMIVRDLVEVADLGDKEDLLIHLHLRSWLGEPLSIGGKVCRKR